MSEEYTKCVRCGEHARKASQPQLHSKHGVGPICRTCWIAQFGGPAPWDGKEILK